MEAAICLSPSPSGAPLQRQERSPLCVAEFPESPHQATPPCYQKFSDIGDDEIKALVWGHIFPDKSRPLSKFMRLWGFVLEDLQGNKLKIRVTYMFHVKTTPRMRVPDIEPSPAFYADWLRNLVHGKLSLIHI